jgi:predicted TIM-barrel fold metal-dependent hydrolase
MPATRQIAIHGVTHGAPAFAVPPGACDCHVHVFGPAARFPYAAGRGYTPGDASIESLLALQAALGLERVVVVQASPYGTDNACTVDALRRLGARARGVAVIDAATTGAALADMHEAGVRGVRVNLESAGQHDPDAARGLLVAAAARAAPLGWHVQTYTSLDVIVALKDTILALPVPLVIDHFGRAPAAAGVDHPGFRVLLSLVDSGRVWVKLSAPHRVSTAPDCADAAALARALMRANPERMVWGSDWPHPGGTPGASRRPEVIEPFHPIDDGRALNRLAEWTASAAELEAILVHNPARLYDF